MKIEDMTEDEFLERLDALGFNQAAFAREMGVSRQAVCRRLGKINAKITDDLTRLTLDLTKTLMDLNKQSFTFLMVISEMQQAISLEAPEVSERINARLSRGGALLAGTNEPSDISQI